MTIAKGIFNFTQNDFAKRIDIIQRRFPDANLEDALSRNQCDSKRWMVNELSKLLLGNAFVMGGWYGTLSYMLLDDLLPCQLKSIRSVDKDPDCAPIADTLNISFVKDGWRFKAVTADIMDIELPVATYEVTKADNKSQLCTTDVDTIINTSCEHMEPAQFQEWLNKIPDETLVALQSNNYRSGKGHINCIDSCIELINQANFKEVIYSGNMVFNEYTRYMVIGYK